MGNDYLLTLDGGTTMREVELTPDVSRVRIGTTKRCDVRFRKEMFFAPFELEVTRDEGEEWTLISSDEVYLSVDGVRKMAVKRLAHGDEFAVKYVDSNTTLLTVRFAIDFEREAKTYDRFISLESIEALTIGGKPNCNLSLSGGYTENDLLVLQRSGTRFVLVEQASKYGTFCNGVRVNERVTVENLSFISIADYTFYLKDGKLYFSRSADIAFNDVKYVDLRAQVKSSEYPRFNRNTRIKSAMDDEKVPVLDPPNKAQKPRTNIIVQLLPAIGMLGIVVLLRGSMMQSSGGSSSFILISAASIGVGILASILGIISDKRRYRKDIKERKEKYTAYIQEKREEVQELRAEELEILEKRYPSVEKELEMVTTFSGDLFDRREGDEDFLHVVFGTGPRESSKQIDFKERESLDIDELADLPFELRNEFRYIENAPIAVDLDANDAVGIVGPPSKSHVVMKNIVIDLCTRHYESDLKLFFLVEDYNEGLIHWARMLPHVQNEELNCRNIVCDEESKSLLFEYLYKEFTARKASKGKRKSPRIVILVLDECGFKNHPLSQFVDEASSIGVTFVFFERMKEFLPMGCDSVITLDRREDSGIVVDTENSQNASSFTYPQVSNQDAEELVNKLAPVYCEEVSLEGALTKSITLFEMLGIISADDLDLSKRWASTAVDKSLAAPLGVTKSKMVYLDLHDKAHGPHGLVAGTTGSGKSEILQTYILSAATLFHPYEISFLIIDFKGGGMVNQFRDLPHLLGAITNIDGREINRSLKSIKAELQKRQRYFADADVNHISNYIKKYKAGEVEHPLPHLIIIVDEFAELKAEQPDFMKELISASRIGRSLGVHLILATQKPAGQVSEQIWSNSRFKLCLKVQSIEDSNEVIKSPLAAEIKEPGRAYLQVGNNEIFELLQSGFSGAPEHDDDDDVREFTLYQVENSGKRVPVFERRRKRSDNVSATQLDAVVAHVANHCAVNRIEHLPSICLPPLEEKIPFPRETRMVEGKVGLGIYDDPDSQYQGEAYFDIDSENTFIVGSSQTGKTNVLQAIIRAIAQTKTPAQASIYIMDFASMVLKNFESLNHVGGVVLASEDERLKNLFKLLNEELALRKKKLLETGVSSFASYLEAGNDDLAHIYVLIDNFAVFKELYAERFEDELMTVCRDGLAYGISVVIANAATSGFGFRYMSNFSSRIALPCNDSGEYSAVFDRCRMEPKNVPGRALFSFDKALYEFQVFLAFEGEKEIDRVKAMRSFVDERNAAYPSLRARRIPSVPDDLTIEYIRDNYDIPLNELAFALNYESVEPVRINLDSTFSLSIIGKDGEAKRKVLDALMHDIHEAAFDRQVEIHVVDGIMRDLQAYRDLPYMEAYYGDASEVSRVFDSFMPRLQERYAKVSEEGLSALQNEPYLIAIVNSIDALNYVSDNQEIMNSYLEMGKQYKNMRVLFVFSDVPDATVSYSSPALLKSIKEERRAFVVTSIPEHKFFDLTATVSRMYRAPLDDRQAFYFTEAGVAKVKISIAQQVI